MRTLTRLVPVVLLLSWISVRPLLADEPHVHDVPGDFGTVRFPVSCTPEAQKAFERAVAVIHSFGYEMAEKAFANVVATDPGCAMGYWGLAMTQWHQFWWPPDAAALQKGRAWIEKAESLSPATQREKDYIEVLAVFYRDSDKLDHKTRAAAYTKAMEELYRKYPNDLEVAAFYGLALIATAPPTDKTYAAQKQAADILEKVYTAEPNHPGAPHYIIHSFDSAALAPQALSAARAYAKIAPDSPHALHMPSHIFTRLGLWQESIDSNMASAEAARNDAARLKMSGTFDQELHAMDYLVYAYLQQGRDAEAKAVLDQTRRVVKTEPVTLAAGYALTAIPARYAVERGRWEEAATLELSPAGYPWERVRYGEATIRFARVAGATRKGDVASARRDVERLQVLREEQAKVKEGYDFTTQIEILRLEAAGLLARAEKQDAEAIRLLRAAADLEDSTEKHPVTPGAIVPARELLGALLLDLGEPAVALHEFEAALRDSPNRFGGLYGAARSARLAGQNEKAVVYYEKLVTLTQVPGAAKRPELAEARDFLAGRKAAVARP